MLWLKGGTLGIRHRAFPLGLLAPRCLGALLFLALPPCGAGARAARKIGGRKESSPQLRAPPHSGRAMSSVPCGAFLSPNASGSLVRAFGVRPRTTPLHVFISDVGSTFSRGKCLRSGRRSSFSQIARRSMPDGGCRKVVKPERIRSACPSHPCAHKYIRYEGIGGVAAPIHKL